MSDCRRLRRVLPALHDGDLPEGERAAARAHLEACPACVAEFRRLEETDRLLTASRPPCAGLSPEASQLVFQQALAESGVLRRGFWGSLYRGWSVVALSAVVAVCAGGLWWRALSPPKHTAPETLAALPTPEPEPVHDGGDGGPPRQVTARQAGGVSGPPRSPRRVGRPRPVAARGRRARPLLAALPRPDASVPPDRGVLWRGEPSGAQETQVPVSARLLVVVTRPVLPRLELTVRRVSEAAPGFAQASAVEERGDGSLTLRQFTVSCSSDQGEPGPAPESPVPASGGGAP